MDTRGESEHEETGESSEDDLTDRSELDENEMVMADGINGNE